MASAIIATLKQISVNKVVAQHAKLLDFKNVKSVKFIFNPFHERVASIRLVKMSWYMSALLNVGYAAVSEISPN